VRDDLVESLLPDLRSLHARATTDLSSLTEKLRVLCRDAQRRGMRAEHVVILVKDLWAQIYDGTSRPARLQHDDQLRAVVTRTINEYYSSEQRFP
ncbi:MAG TPA: hypothetical protein VKP02_02840, partial [Gemmatimonadaceae bacterium]|nr:hypothetical protein [Gemmatimonadaceae bacterium]